MLVHIVPAAYVLGFIIDACTIIRCIYLFLPDKPLTIDANSYEDRGCTLSVHFYEPGFRGPATDITPEMHDWY